MQLNVNDYKDDYMEVTDTKVYDLAEAVAASGLPMLKNFNGNLVLEMDSITEAIRNRGSKLGSCPTGEGHDNFLGGVLVSFNVKYAVYWSPQFQRYNFAKIVSSQSTMHRVTKMDLEKVHMPGVSLNTLSYCKDLVNFFDEMLIMRGTKGIEKFNVTFNRMNEVILVVPHDPNNFVLDEEGDLRTTKVMTPEEMYHILVQNLPQGQTKWMRVTTNYLQLKTMYYQRREHKLPDWRQFCKWCESLPYFKVFLKLTDKK